MWQDPIVEEIRKAREEYASQFDYDLDAICADLRRQQEEEGRKVVSFAPRPARIVPRLDRRPATVLYKQGNVSAGTVVRDRDVDVVEPPDQETDT